MNRCVVFGGADIDYSEISGIPEGAYVIAADSGLRHCDRLCIPPDLIVGDFDSLGYLPQRACRIITAPEEKDDTDLLLAVKEALSAGCGEIHIYGADGGRMGHTMASVQTLAYIEAKGAKGVLYGAGFEMCVIGKGDHSFGSAKGSYISLFSLTEKSELCASGVKYAGMLTLRSDFPLGVSNRFTSDTAKIEVFGGKVLVILEK